MEDIFGHDCSEFDKLMEVTKEWLLVFDGEKRLNIVREILKNPHYDESDVYMLCLNEYQTCPPFPRNPVRIRSPMKPIEPATKENNNTVLKKSEIRRRGRIRARDEDWNGDEEWKGTVKKKKQKKVNHVVLPKNPPDLQAEIRDRRIRTLNGTDVIPVKKSEIRAREEDWKGREEKKKENVNHVVLPKNPRDLPAEIRDRIRALNGTDVIMVMEKELYETDVNTNNGRLSMPSRRIDMRFLSEEEKVFLETEAKGRIRSRIIGEGGMDHEICLCKWIMPKPNSLSKNNVSVIYNLISGWNDVLKAHELRNDRLCKHNMVQLWSFRAEGNLRFAIVKV